MTSLVGIKKEKNGLLVICQGKTMEELKENLLDINKGLISDTERFHILEVAI